MGRRILIFGIVLFCSTAFAQQGVDFMTSGGGADQNLWETISSDSGSTTADTTTDTLTVSGGGTVSTKISGDILTITGAAGAAAAGGADTQIQFNDSGVIGGAGAFVYTKGTGNVYMGQDAHIVGNITVTGAGSNTQILFNDGTIEGDTNLVFNKTTNTLTTDHIVATAGLEVNGDVVPANLAGLNHHLRFNLVDPNALFDTDETFCIWPQTDAAVTITQIEVTLDADPAKELAVDLMYANVFIAHPSAVIIDDLTTTSGTTSISSGFDNANVPANKAVFIRLDGDPDSNITQANYDITYDYD